MLKYGKKEGMKGGKKYPNALIIVLFIETLFNLNYCGFIKSDY